MSETTGANTQTQTQGSTQPLTDAQLRAVLDEYGLARSDDVRNIDAKADAIAAAVSANGQKVDGVAAAVAADGSTVVLIDDSQWDTIETKWETAGKSMQVVLFLALVVALLLAAIFGNRLWGAFSKGWRR